jgi:hypothetical protein
MPSEVYNQATLGPLFRYWDKKRGDRAMPTRREIDPIEMGPKLLPHLMLCELADQGSRIRFRLVGTILVKRFGFDPTGQWLGELPKSDYLDYLGKLLRQANAEGAPIYGESNFRWGAKGRLEVRHLLLPLATNEDQPSMVLIGMSYSSDEVFPPQIRVLDTQGVHTIGKREVLPLSTPASWKELKPAHVA